MKHRFTASVILAGVLWGVIGLFVRSLGAAGLDSLQVAFVRVLFSVILLFPILLCFKREYLKIRLRHLWCFIGTGVCSLTFFNFCYFYTMTATSLSVASILLYTAPVFVAVMSAFLFRERMNTVSVLSLVLALGGCALVTGVLFDTPALSPLGILIGLGAGFGYALYSIFSRYALERGYHAMTVTFWTFLTATVAMLPFVRPTELLGRVAEGEFPWISGILLAAVSTVLPYLLYTYGLTGMTGGRASILATVEPVVATLTGVIVYREEMTGWSILGTVLVLGAVMLPNLIPKRKHQKST
ncbi:MAG: EamA family transporter [Clostridia bacterium]|nr:EamA family transporter [Clostridia bacterium]